MPTPQEILTASAVSGNQKMSTGVSSTAVYKPRRHTPTQDNRNLIAKPWQIDAYRHVNICGEARYAATLFAAVAGRAEIGISKAQALRGKAQWIDEGPEVDALAELAPTVRERTKLIRDYMLHRVIAGECYLIARDRVSHDPGYIEPPDDVDLQAIDLLDPEFDAPEFAKAPPIWEIVAVTELRRQGSGENEIWQVRHENENWITLRTGDPVIRLWVPDPENRREAWSPFRSLLPTLKEIEWLTGHIFTQVRSRMMSAGVWFLPNNLTFAPPPPDAVEGGEETIANMNEAEKFMASLAASAMTLLDVDEVSFPSVVMSDPAALDAVDPEKLIKFWSEIDDAAMRLRADNIRRFALGMDMPPEQILGSSGLAVSGGGGSAGSVNHWGVWANEEQTISAHIEPALDDFVHALTTSVLNLAVEGTENVVAYDTATLRLRQDRSKESIELNQMGLLSGKVTLRENGFDPENDLMDDEEFKRWLLVKVAGGSATPDQVNESLRLLGVILNVEPSGGSDAATRQPGRNAPPSLEQHPYEGPPRVDHEHNDAPFSALHASCEALVLRALEKAGNRLLNDGKRGRDKDRSTPAHMAHIAASVTSAPEFDFTLLPTMLGHLPAHQQGRLTVNLRHYCATLYETSTPYTREGLIQAVETL